MPAAGVVSPVTGSRMTDPPILCNVLAGEFPPERFRLGLRSLSTPSFPGLALSLTRNAASESWLRDVKARDIVLGRKKPSFPRGIDKP